MSTIEVTRASHPALFDVFDAWDEKLPASFEPNCYSSFCAGYDSGSQYATSQLRSEARRIDARALAEAREVGMLHGALLTLIPLGLAVLAFLLLT